MEMPLSPSLPIPWPAACVSDGDYHDRVATLPAKDEHVRKAADADISIFPGQYRQYTHVLCDSRHGLVNGNAKSLSHFEGSLSIPIPRRTVFTSSEAMKHHEAYRHQFSARKSVHATFPWRSAKRTSNSSINEASSIESIECSAGTVFRSLATRASRSSSGSFNASAKTVSEVGCMAHPQPGLMKTRSQSQTTTHILRPLSIMAFPFGGVHATVGRARSAAWHDAACLATQSVESGGQTNRTRIPARYLASRQSLCCCISSTLVVNCTFFIAFSTRRGCLS
jgi:hypothetical protein